MSLTCERIAGSLGAVVHGVDIGSPLAPDVLAELRQSILDHLVVFLPDQPRSLDALERFTDELGGRDTTPFVRPVDDRPFVIRVIKEPHDELNFANAWHSDLSYLAAPPSFTVLQAWETPPFGGDTLWANQYRAYETLPADIRKRLLSLTAVHSAGMAYGTGGYLDAVQEKSSMTIAPSADAYATQTHPVVIRHPETGRAALFVNPVYTTAIEGLSADESMSLLGRLCRHSVNENFTCRIRWQPGMIAIWDNRCTQHFAINDYAGQRREMFRTSVRGSTPEAFAADAFASDAATATS
jgi:taurine dioxygenase